MKTDPPFDENHFYLDATFISSLKSFIENNRTQPEAIKPEIVHQFETILVLTFISEKAVEGNLCFANNKEMQTEFKQTFNSTAIYNYIFAFYQSTIYNDNLKIPYPKDSETFWKFVELGFELHKNQDKKI